MIYMLHSVGASYVKWPYQFLSVRLKHLEIFFKHLNKKKIKTVFVKDLYQNDFKLPDKSSIALTFDDGFLDNWVYLFPLLQQYKIKATIFISPEFAEGRTGKKPFLDREQKSNDKMDDILGYLSWDEIIEMESSKYIDIQSHSMSHTWYYSNERIIDFYIPPDINNNINSLYTYPWISWNENLQKKIFSFTSKQHIPQSIGMPIYENERSLKTKVFIPDQEIINKLVNYTTDNIEIFQEKKWRLILKSKYEKIINGRKNIGTYESNKQTEERYIYELKNSKEILEKKLNKKIEILCWPGGKYNDMSLEISKKVGYLASTLNSGEKLSSNTNSTYKRIRRYGLSEFLEWKNKSLGISQYPRALIAEFSQNKFDKQFLRIEKLLKWSFK